MFMEAEVAFFCADDKGNNLCKEIDYFINYLLSSTIIIIVLRLLSFDGKLSFEINFVSFGIRNGRHAKSQMKVN